MKIYILILILLSQGVGVIANPGDEYKGVKLTKDIVSKAKILPANVDVFEDTIINNYSTNMFGVNFDWNGFEYLKPGLKLYAHGFPIISDQYSKTMSGVPLILNRMAGAESQKFQWKKAIGPYQIRQKQKLVSWRAPKIQNAGLVEWINSCRQISPNARFVWVVNMTSDTPQDAADLAEFLMGNKDSKWGKKRLEYKLTKPVKPFVWELGNEMDWEGKISLSKYINRCKATMKAIRRIQPDAMFAAHAKTAPWDARSKNNWQKWHQEILNKLAKDIDYIAFHPYYHGHKPAYLEQFLDKIESDIKKSANPNIKILMTEHAKWPPNSDKGHKVWKTHWYKTHALCGCLETAEWIIRMLNRPIVAGMNYHSHSSGPWGMIYRDKASGKLYTTGIADLYKLFAELPAKKVVKCTVTGLYADVHKNNMSFSAVALKGRDNRLFMIFDNRLPNTTRKVNFKFQNSYCLKKVTTLYADSLLAHNTVSDKQIKEKVLNKNSSQKITSYEIAAKSLVFLELVKIAVNDK